MAGMWVLVGVVRMIQRAGLGHLGVLSQIVRGRRQLLRVSTYLDANKN